MFDYLTKAIQIYLKQHYFRNGAIGVNPMSMGYFKLLEYAKIHEINLNDLYAEIGLFWKKADSAMHYNMPLQVNDILTTLYEESKQSYLVGGCVRDSINLVASKDWDFVTDIPYDTIKEVLLNKFPDMTFKETGKQFLVLNCILNDITYEVANFRKDGVYLDGRRPESVEIGTIEEDANRRDFTINAMYWNYDGLKTPIYDSVSNIKNKVLKFIGNPHDRISEDALRVFRFYRFIKTKGLVPDKPSLQAVRSHFDLAMKVSSHRVMMEIERIVL